MKHRKMKSKKLICEICSVLSAIVLAALLFTGAASLSPEDAVGMTITRAVGSISIIFLIAAFDYRILAPIPRGFLHSLASVLPCIAVAVNNLHIIVLVTGRASITADASQIILFFIECFFVGLFEEAAFRGVVQMALLERIGTNKHGVLVAVIISSAIFGVSHLANIVSGACVGESILQAGYSFLTGGMFSFVLIRTRSIWFCALLHGIYNFCGNLVPELGEASGPLWTPAQIVLTASVAIIVGIYVVAYFVKTR
jgi:membrane protease YdiL (CAAX protease family)